MTDAPRHASFSKNSDPLTVGAAATIADLAELRDWLIAGQRDLELNDIASPGAIDGDDWEAQAEAIKDALTGYTGLFGIHGPFFALDITGADPEITTVSQRRLLQGLDYAKLVGAGHMVVHSPFHPFIDTSNRSTFEGYVTAVCRGLEPIVARAAEIGTTLVLENILDYTSRGVIAVAETFNTPHFRLSVDVGHAELQARRGGTSPKQFINEVGPYLEHVHLQDNDGAYDRHWAVGDGELSWYGIMEAIAALDHTPRLIIETSAHDVRRSFDYFVARGLAR